MSEPTDTPWIDPATCNLVRVIRVRRGDDYVAHIHAAALAPLRSRWADEVQAVKKAGAARSACRQSLDRTRQRVAVLREASAAFRRSVKLPRRRRTRLRDCMRDLS